MNLRLGSVPFQFPRAKGLCLTLPPEITGPSITPACSELHLHLTLIFSLLSVYAALESWSSFRFSLASVGYLHECFAHWSGLWLTAFLRILQIVVAVLVLSETL